MVRGNTVNVVCVRSSRTSGVIAENRVKAHEVVSKRKMVPTGTEQLTEYRN